MWALVDIAAFTHISARTRIGGVPVGLIMPDYMPSNPRRRKRLQQPRRSERGGWIIQTVGNAAFPSIS
jgi:hypothetical protein